MNNINLVVFDMDGVLAEIKDIHFECLNKALSSVSASYVISHQDHLTKFDGLKTYDKLDLLSQERGLPLKHHQTIWNIKQQLTEEALKNINPEQNIVDALRFLKHNNITIAVASNSIRQTIKTVLESTGYDKYIDFYLSNQDVINTKPSPEIYLKAMLMAGSNPAQTLIVEDSPVGIQAAKDSGANVVIVKSPKDVTVCLMEKNMYTNTKPKWKNSKLNIVIPMAGNGSRFASMGYTYPKPLITVNEKTMIQQVVDNLNIDANYTFICQQEHYDKYSLKYLLSAVAPGCNIVTLDHVTEGAACTVLLAKEYIDNDNPLLIANSDQFVEWFSNNSDSFYYTCENMQHDGAILTFESLHPKWSYVKLDDDGFATEVAEKKPISNIATVGIYFWKRGSDFVKYAHQMIDKDLRVNNEFYVCPVFNEAIQDGKKFITVNVKKMWGLGTPEDLEYFLQNHEQ